MTRIAQLLLLAALVLIAGCSGGGEVDQKSLVQSQKEINASKEKGDNAWQD